MAEFLEIEPGWFINLDQIQEVAIEYSHSETNWPFVTSGKRYAAVHFTHPIIRDPSDKRQPNETQRVIAFEEGSDQYQVLGHHLTRDSEK